MEEQIDEIVIAQADDDTAWEEPIRVHSTIPRKRYMDKVAITNEERLKLLLWLIDRYDTRRASHANLSPMIVSADAVIAAAATFLLDKSLSSSQVFGTTERIVLLVSLSLTFVLLAISIFFATTGIANVWRTTRQLFGPGIPDRDFFHARDTLEKGGGFKGFAERFKAVSNDQLEGYALGELWTITKATHYRYQKLRLAIAFLVFALIPFSITLIVYLHRIV